MTAPVEIRSLDPELHAPFLVALRLLPQPDLHAVRELCNEFARANK